MKRFIGGAAIADRVSAVHILEKYHYGNLLQDVSKLAPILKPAISKMVVWRGLRSTIIGGLDLISEMEKNGSVNILRLTSTGATPEVAVNFCGSIDRNNLCVILKINLAKGFPIIDVNDTLRSTRLYFPGEKEYLLLPEVERKRLTFNLIRKTVSPDESTSDTVLIQGAILENEKEGANMYWYKHPTRLLKKLEKRFVIYEVTAKYV